MKLSLMDYGKGTGSLEELLMPLRTEYSFINLETTTEVIKAKGLARITSLFKLTRQFNKWAKLLSKQVPEETIAIALMPYQPTEKELGLNSFVYHSRIIPTGINYYQKLILLNNELLTGDRLITVAIHEVYDILNKDHYTHNGKGLTCVNNGDTNFKGDNDFINLSQNIENTYHYLDTASPWLCDDCRQRLKERLEFFKETDNYVTRI